MGSSQITKLKMEQTPVAVTVTEGYWMRPMLVHGDQCGCFVAGGQYPSYSYWFINLH